MSDLPPAPHHARRTTHVVALATLVTGAITPSVHAQTALALPDLDAGALAEITDRVAAVVDRGELAGAVVAVSRNGRIGYLQSVGMQDIESGTRMSNESIFRIYSMSRAITGVAVGTLVDDGRLSFDDPVSEYLPEFANVRVRNEDGGTRTPSRPATVRDLLLHTAGMNFRNARDYRDADVRSRNRPLSDFVERHARVPLWEDPGTRFRYGTGSTIASAVVEAAAGQPFDEYVRERVFEPLGMVDTGFWASPDKAARLATPYRSEDGAPLEPYETESTPFTELPALRDGAVGMVSTAPDFLRFCQMLLNGGELDGSRVLSTETAAELTENGLSQEIRLARRGAMGWSMANAAVVVDADARSDGAQPGEYTWNGSVGADFWVDPNTNTIVVTMWQNSPANPAGLRQQILDIVRRAIR